MGSNEEQAGAVEYVYDFDDSARGKSESVDIVAAMWRYKWAVLAPAMLGLLTGILIWARLPEIYESSARILVESESPVVLETGRGEYMANVPGSDVIRAQLFSDGVLKAAEDYINKEDPNAETDQALLKVIEPEYGSFKGFARENVRFVAESDDSKQVTSLAFRMSVRHTNGELAALSTKAMNFALMDYFQKRGESSLQELKTAVEQAYEKVLPQLQKQQEEYRQWRDQVQLQTDPEGNVINPYRLEQNRLELRRSQLEAELQASEAQFKAVKTTLDNTTDPRTAIKIISQLLDRELVLPDEDRGRISFKEEDFDLKQLGFQEQLVPLIVRRQEVAGQFGENHPSVKTLDNQIEFSRREFTRLSKEMTDRIAKLLDRSEQEQEQAAAAAQAVVSTLMGQTAMLGEQLEILNNQIDKLRKQADEVQKDAQENILLREELDRTEELLTQLEEQMARINLTDRKPGLTFVPLTQPTNAYIVGPSLLFWSASCLGVGLMLGCALAYLLEGQAGTFRTATEISSTLGSPVLSHIPFDPGKKRKLKKDASPLESLDDKLSVLHRPSSMAAEAVRALRTAILFDASANNSKVIQITSPLPSDGKTTMVGNLGVSLAQAGKRVVIIDADLRRPQLSDNFNLQGLDGMTDVLNGDCDPDSAIHATPVDNLYIMPSGPIPSNPAEALTLPETGELINWLRDRFDFVLVDTPPLLVVTDASIVAGMVDGVALTVKIRRKSRANAKEAISILQATGARVIGVIVNASDDSVGSDGYKGYGYYRYSHYSSKYKGNYGLPTDSSSGKQKSGGRRSTVVVPGKSRLIGGEVVDDAGRENGKPAALIPERE